MTRLLLLRHGESEWNAQGRWQGWADPPLSAPGRVQAAAAGRLLRSAGFTAVAASDLQRARLTAELAAAELGLSPAVHIDAGLREYDVGEWSGLTRAEIEARWPHALEDWRHGRLVATPGGETRDAFIARIAAAVTRVATTHAQGTVLVITHGGVIGALERSLGADQRRLAHLGGRWVEASDDGLRAGEVVFLFEPDADTEAASQGRPPEAAEGEGTELSERGEVCQFRATEQGAGTLPSGTVKKVEVVRSPRRRKTVQAREVNGVLRVSIPATMTKADEAHWVAEMIRRMERRTAANDVDLARRADQLAARYRLRRPTSIRWVNNQEWRWGSCTPGDGAIRISTRLAGEPMWVLDYVIVHELAHLHLARHNAAFWSLVNRYPHAERARGFLIARGLEPA
jgi:broad specificity phosphatase PhoE/predicted metal-dependent hydrolase